jgi:plasmid maintenance system antidote protein VapI
MKKQSIIFIIGIFLLLLIGCQEENEPTTDAPLNNFFANTELNYGEYVFIFEDLVERARALDLKDKTLEKWVIRALGDEKISNKRDLTQDEALKIAKKNQAENQAWITVAEEKYEVKVTEEELDQWISAGPDQSEIPQQKAFADALKLSIEDLNHEFDRELYKQTLLWEKLIPVLEKKYETKDREVLLDKYMEQVEQEKKIQIKKTTGT